MVLIYYILSSDFTSQLQSIISYVSLFNFSDSLYCLELESSHLQSFTEREREGSG